MCRSDRPTQRCSNTHWPCFRQTDRALRVFPASNGRSSPFPGAASRQPPSPLRVCDLRCRSPSHTIEVGHRPGRAAAHDESKTNETRRLNGATAPHGHLRDQVRAASPIVAAILGDHRDEPLPSIPDHAILQWTNLYSHAISGLRNLRNHRHDCATQAWEYFQLEDERLELAQVDRSHLPLIPSVGDIPDVRIAPQTRVL